MTPRTKRLKSSHRIRVTLRSTAVSSAILLVLLLSVSAYLKRGTELFLDTSLHHSLELMQTEVEKGHLAPSEIPKIKNPLLSVGTYDRGGHLIFSAGRDPMPKFIDQLSPPPGTGVLTGQNVDDTTLVVMLDFSERLADLHHTIVVLLLLWPALTLLIGVATFFAVSSSFAPLNKLLDQARQLKMNDRLETPDQAEFGELADSINHYLSTIQRVVARQEEFAVDAAHELCTPLTALRGSLEVALRKKDDQAALKSAAVKAVDQVSRLQRLVEGLLLAARPTQGKVTNCHADEVVEEVLARWVDQFTGKGVFFDVETEAFDAAMRSEELEAVISNLLANAFKFSPINSTVHVKLTGDGIVSVQDEGPGIPEEQLDVIFNRFESGNSMAGGHGIGLYLVKKLLDQRGGTVQALPCDTGALFRVKLPHAIPSGDVAAGTARQA